MSFTPSCLTDDQFPEEEGGIHCVGVEAHGSLCYYGSPAAPHELRGTGSAPTRRPHRESHCADARYWGRGVCYVTHRGM